MTALLLLLALQLPGGVFKAPELQYFPSDYFNESEAWKLQARVLDRWPGPTRLLELWESGGLKDRQKAALLLGASAFHDPELLPIYGEALRSESLQLRMAAAWGYRALIGDLPPGLEGQIPDQLYVVLAGEVEAVRQSARRHTLVQIWLASALAAEGREEPGWNGVIFRRPAVDCIHAVARLLKPEDLQDVISAYEMSENMTIRISLTRMLEALTLQRFIFKPRQPRAGWGLKVYEEAFDRVDQYLAANCLWGSRRLQRRGFSQLGVVGVDPDDSAACDVWIRILKMPMKSWWPVAADHIYQCGGPPSNLSVDLRAAEQNKAARGWILKWYGY